MPTQTINRQWLLARRPAGQVLVDDFRRYDAPLPRPDLAAGEILVRNLMFGFDPAQRGWMDDVPSYMPPIALGDAVRAATLGIVHASDNPAFAPGDWVVKPPAGTAV